MCLLSFLKWGSIGYSLGIVQWDFTRWDHPGNPGRVSRSGPVSMVPVSYLLWSTGTGTKKSVPVPNVLFQTSVSILAITWSFLIRFE